MSAAWKTLSDLDPAGKRCLVRVDFNVPFVPGTQSISDDSRIVSALPTIENLLNRGASLVVCSHLGRPKGRSGAGPANGPGKKSVLPSFSEPMWSTAAGPGGLKWDQSWPPLVVDQVGMLENLRFDPGEESNDDDFSRGLASLADVYVNDAFGAAHRAHASVVGVTEYLPSYAGLLMQQGTGHAGPRVGFA